MPREAGVVTIRRAEPDDYEAFYRTYQEREAYRGTLQPPFPSREGWRKRLSEPSADLVLFVACIDGEVVGNAGLHGNARERRAHAMSVGLTVRSEHHGKGIGSALMQALCDSADKWMNVIRLELTVFTDNDRAIALYRKFGFEVEGTHKAYALRDGVYADVHAMARIRPKPAPV
jgi:L-phenylalanine/L-methionine N-acetyltransferase